MKAARTYAILEAKMLRDRALGLLAETAYDAILEEMDELWEQMSEDERLEANARAAAIARLRAPETLALDVEVEEGDADLPRRAA